MTRVRLEEPTDIVAIRIIHERAFGGQAEADLVDALRDSGDAVLSLVAEEGRDTVGHILFSRLDTTPPIRALALAPMAVLPEFQRRGIGTALIHDGLKRLAGWDLIVVLGHTTYYPRFGFSLELGRKIRCPYSGDHLMARGTLPFEITARYPAPFHSESA